MLFLFEHIDYNNDFIKILCLCFSKKLSREFHVQVEEEVEEEQKKDSLPLHLYTVFINYGRAL